MMQEFSASVLRAAKKLESSDRLEQDAEYERIWWVQGEGGRYRVQLDHEHPPKWITCTCPHGRHKGAGEVRCKHAAAVLMRLEVEEP